MGDVSRRSVLKSMTKLSMAAATAPLVPWISGCCGHKDRRIQLNVVLHGLFVLHITDFCIELLTPKIEEHVHRVGSWDVRRIHPLESGKNYVLRGVNHEKRLPEFDKNCTPNFSQEEVTFSVDAEKSRHSVQLPFPAGIHLLRCTPPYPGAGLQSTGNRGSDIDIYRLSLCQVLTYNVPDYRELILLESCWEPYISKTTFTCNLHLWAEPDKRATPKHAYDAYAQLQTLLPPLQFNLKVESTVPLDRDTGVCGLPPEEEQGWSDWASGGGEGTRPTNCCAVMAAKKL